jgi:hypothetical protein
VPEEHRSAASLETQKVALRTLTMDYWEANKLKKPQQVVVCAACRMGDHIVLGARHFDERMREQMDRTSCNWKLAEQGFIDQFGAFLSREEAMNIVKSSGQPFDIERNRGDKILFSEGLY